MIEGTLLSQELQVRQYLTQDNLIDGAQRQAFFILSPILTGGLTRKEGAVIYMLIFVANAAC